MLPSSPSPAQLQAVSHVRAKVTARKPPEQRLAPQEALRELLRNSTVYGDGSAMAPYRDGLVSLPESITGTPLVSDVLNTNDREMVIGFAERVLLPPSELDETLATEGEARAYFDPILKRRPLAYAGLLRRLLRIGLIRWGRSCKCECGLFFVPKKSGSLRMIVDARRINQLCRKPPSVQLATGDSLSRIEVPADLALHVAHSDVDNCFHRLRMPEEMQGWFCLPPIAAKHLGLTELGGIPLRPDGKVWPTLRTLPVGFSWSLYFAQGAHEHIVGQVPGFSDETWLRDRHPPGGLQIGRPHHLAYVDNMGVLGYPAKDVTEMKERGQAAMMRAGLKMHEDVEAGGAAVDLLGFTIRASPALVELKQGRTWRLEAALRHAARLRRISGRALEVLVGHATFAFLLRRCCLSVFGKIYGFIQCHYHDAGELWSSVRQELINAAALLPLVCAELGRPWATEVWCVDAATHGLAVMRSEWQRRSVMEVGRLEERWRFRGEGGGRGARTRALAQEENSLGTGGWPEVPRRLLRPGRWRLVHAGRVRDSAQPIHLKEGEAALIVAKRLVRAVGGGQGQRHLLLGDNMSVACALGKGQATDPALLAVTREWAALQLAGDMQIAYRWIPSEFNTADRDSRRWEGAEPVAANTKGRDLADERLLEAVSAPPSPRSHAREDLGAPARDGDAGRENAADADELCGIFEDGALADGEATGERPWISYLIQESALPQSGFKAATRRRRGRPAGRGACGGSLFAGELGGRLGLREE